MIGAVLIADDEPLARRTLRTHLRNLGWRGPIHEAPDGTTAIAMANRERPHLLFLDVVMPGATGLQVLEHLEYETNVILTTAHDQYAVTAFELGALDYLLKPFGRQRVARVIERVNNATAGSAGTTVPSGVPLLSRARDVLQPARALSRIFVRDGPRIVPVAVASIERVQGADDYATIVTAAKEYLVSVRLSALEAHLARANFLRVHRSHLINLEYVTAIQPCEGSTLQVIMKSGAAIVASRAGTKRLRELAL